jgi:tripartite-type tricarboxylate transporter receptor subunit TctC
MDRRKFLAGAAALVGSSCPSFAASLLRFVYPYAAGSGGDTLCRLLAEKISQSLGVTAIVENKTGADGRIGVREVKNSQPDGSTLLFTPFGTMVLLPTVFKDLGYDAFSDFVPVTQLLTFDFGLAAGPMSGAKTLKEMAEWLKKNPDKSDVAVPALGTLPHLLPLKFAAESGARIQAIAYKGIAPSLTAVMGGQVALVCAPVADLVAQHQAGKVHLLAVSGKTRSKDAPEVPTFVEQGYQIEGDGWYGIFAPAHTPADVVTKLNQTLVDAVHSQEFQQRAKALHLTPTGTTPAELGAIQKKDFERWAPIIKAAGLAGK